MYEESEQICRLYANTKGPGTRAVPERHQFFINLGTMINRISEKCERENGMMLVLSYFIKKGCFFLIFFKFKLSSKTTS